MLGNRRFGLRVQPTLTPNKEHQFCRRALWIGYVWNIFNNQRVLFSTSNRIKWIYLHAREIKELKKKKSPSSIHIPIDENFFKTENLPWNRRILFARRDGLNNLLKTSRRKRAKGEIH